MNGVDRGTLKYQKVIIGQIKKPFWNSMNDSSQPSFENMRSFIKLGLTAGVLEMDGAQ